MAAAAASSNGSSSGSSSQLSRSTAFDNGSAVAGGNAQALLYLRMENSRTICSLLKTIHFKELATVCASVNGLKVTVEDCKSLQANVYLQSGLFATYRLRHAQPIFFRLNLTFLLECLQLLADADTNSSPVLELFFPEDRSAVELVLEEAGVVTECRVRTIDPDETLDFCFNASALSFKVIIRSEPLKDVFAELDTNSELIELFVSSQRQVFRVCTFGELGSGMYDFPADSETVELFQCDDASVSFRYKLSLVRSCTKALHASAKTSIRCDHRGFLSLQFLVESHEGHNCFVEFFLVPNEPDEEDEEGDDDNEFIAD